LPELKQLVRELEARVTTLETGLKKFPGRTSQAQKARPKKR